MISLNDNKLERINSVAKDIFIKKGYAETKMSEIAHKADLSVGTLYRHYKSKKELFDSLGIPEKETFRPEFEKKRMEIVKVALTLFGEKGFNRTTMDDISQQIGLSKSALYQYFNNKEEILLSIAKGSEMHSLLNDLSKPNSMGGDINSIDEIGFEFLAMFNQPEKINLLRTVICESTNYPELGHLFYQETIENAFNKVAMYIRKMNVSERLNSKFAARVFLGMLLSFVITDKLINNSEGEFSEAEIVSGIVDIFLNGIKENRRLMEGEEND